MDTLLPVVAPEGWGQGALPHLHIPALPGSVQRTTQKLGQETTRNILGRSVS